MPTVSRVVPSAPDEHPEPSPTFDHIALPVRQLGELRTQWWRLYDSSHPSSLHWGRAERYRFDDPLGKYGVLYAGEDTCCAFIETFGDSHGKDGTLEIAEADLNARSLAVITMLPTLSVVDLTGAGLANIGADARLTDGDDYGLSRRWSRAIWDHPSYPDGIYYRARHDPERRSLALFDRPTAKSITERTCGSLADPKNAAEFAAILRRYVVTLL